MGLAVPNHFSKYHSHLQVREDIKSEGSEQGPHGGSVIGGGRVQARPAGVLLLSARTGENEADLKEPLPS